MTLKNVIILLKNKTSVAFRIIKKTIKKFLTNHDLLIANGLAFKTIFAIIPVLAVILAISSIFPSFSLYKDKILEYLIKYILPTYIDEIVDFIELFLSKIKVVSIIGVIGILYLSLDLFITLDNEMNKIWSTSVKRNLIQKYLIYWALLTVTPIVLTGYFYYSGVIRSFITPITGFINLDEIYYSFFTLIFIEAFVFFLFYVIPNTRIHFGKAIIISTLVSLSWIVLRFVFTYYARLFVSTWTIYGSIVALIFFMLWISSNWVTLLFGAELLNVWQNRLYIENLLLKRNFIFDVAYLLLILSDFYKDFRDVGNGITIGMLSSKYHANINDLNMILSIFESERIIISDNEPVKRYFIRKDISHIKLSDIEGIVIRKLLDMHYVNNKEFINISNKLEKYYFVHKEDIDVNIESIIA